MNRQSTYRLQERLMAQRHAREDRRVEEARRVMRDKHMTAALKCMEGSDRKRYQRHVREELKKSQAESGLFKATVERIIREKQLEQEERIAKETARIDLEKQREEKKREHIIKKSKELQELESKLKRVQLNEERNDQPAEKQAIRFEAMENKNRWRLRIQQTYQEQMAFQEMQKQAEKAEEENFRKMMMEKFAEDDRIEQMNDQKQRMKRLEHKRKVEKLFEDKRLQIQANMVQNTLNIDRGNEENEALRRQEVEQERQRLLKRHALKLTEGPAP